MYILPGLAIVFALLESYAVFTDQRNIEFIAKPAVMALLLAWLAQAVGLQGPGLWFGLGVSFSLVGDVLLLWGDRFFLPGLFAFMLTHIFYIIGLNSIPPALSLWSLLLALVLALGAARILRRILAGIHESGRSKPALPVAMYGLVITMMLLSALLTLSNLQWSAWASLCTAAGAFLFSSSDTVLAWNKFVKPINRGRLINISIYELGQILLITGAILQFSRR